MASVIVIGSSPTAPEAYRLVRNQQPAAAVITTNAGIWIEPAPTVYVVIDKGACDMHRQDARDAKAAGAWCVTLRREPSSLKARFIDWFDEFVDCGHYAPTRGNWGSFQFSGLFCIEYALRRMGASELHIVGCEGYGTAAGDYFEISGKQNVPGVPQERYRRLTHETIRPRCEELTRLFPEVQFFCYGNISYRVEGGNWKAIPLA